MAIAMRVKNFDGGWGVPLCGAEKAHYFLTHPLTDKYVKSRCGLVYNVEMMCDEGSFKRCKRCNK